MHANSRPISSTQTGIHENLEKLVTKHATSEFLKPLAAYNAAAFDASIAAWRRMGESPLILDAGCGTGVSTLHLAMQFPDHFVIGVDQSADRLDRNVGWPGTWPANFIKVRADLVDFWRLMHQAGIRPDRHYLLYPNPWPKKHHVARRWHGHAVFPTIVALGGHFECRSNWRIYIDECAAALSQLTAIEIESEQYLPNITNEHRSHVAETTVHLVPITPFESKYLASGHTLWRCRANLMR